MAGLGPARNPCGVHFAHKGSLDAVAFCYKIEEIYGESSVIGLTRMQDPSIVEVMMKTEDLKNKILTGLPFEFKGKEFKAMPIPGEFTSVLIKGLSISIDDRDVIEYLRAFGEIGRTKRFRYKDSRFLNGNRMYEVRMNTPVPNLIVIKQNKAQALYPGVKVQCIRCRQTSHLIAECPRGACYNCGMQGHQQNSCKGTCKKCSLSHTGKCKPAEVEEVQVTKIIEETEEIATETESESGQEAESENSQEGPESPETSETLEESFETVEDPSETLEEIQETTEAEMVSKTVEAPMDTLDPSKEVSNDSIKNAEKMLKCDIPWSDFPIEAVTISSRDRQDMIMNNRKMMNNRKRTGEAEKPYKKQ